MAKRSKDGLQRAGDLFAGLGSQDVTAGAEIGSNQLTTAQRKLANASAEIRLDPGDADDACYLHTVLCQIGLPRKRTSGIEFERRNGSAFLSLTAGKVFNGRQWIQQPLPFGPKPRIMLINLTTTAVMTGRRTVDVGRSMREFMLRVGLDPQGSEYRSLRQQIAALAACHMRIGAVIGNRAVNINAEPIEGFDVWLTPNQDQQTLWPQTVQLTEKYFDSAREHAVPLDERAIAALRGSALAIDCYTWLANRLCRVKGRNGDPVRWAAIKGQFGQEFSRLDNFKAKFRIALSQVRAVYPAADVRETAEGIRLYVSPPPIARASVYLS